MMYMWRTEDPLPISFVVLLMLLIHKSIALARLEVKHQVLFLRAHKRWLVFRRHYAPVFATINAHIFPGGVRALGKKESSS